MTVNRSETGSVRASVQARVRLQGDDATLIAESWTWRRDAIRVDTVVEILSVQCFEGEAPVTQYAVRAYGPVQTEKSRRDHATRRSEIVWTNVREVPMALLPHLVGRDALQKRLTALFVDTTSQEA